MALKHRVWRFRIHALNQWDRFMRWFLIEGSPVDGNLGTLSEEARRYWEYRDRQLR